MKYSWLFKADRDTQRLLLSAHPWIGRVFTTVPVGAALVASTGALVLLFLPAYLFGLAHIKTARGDVGFAALANWNWSLTYPVGLPFLLVFGNYAFRAMHAAAHRLIAVGMSVIYDQDGAIALDYPDFLTSFMQERGRYVVIASAVLAFLAVGADTHDLWPGFVTGHYPASRAPEWDTAFAQLREVPGYVAPPLWQNLVFDIVAYAFESVYAFLGIFFVLTSLTFLLGIARVLDARQGPYRFEPIACDPRRRLGLSPLAWVFNWFLAVVLGFEVFAVAHRIQQVDRLRRVDRTTYVYSLLKDAATQDSAKGEEKRLSLASVLKLTSKDYAFPELRNPSSWVPLLIVFLPAAVVCFLPLGVIRRIVTRKVDELLDQNALALANAEERGDTAEARRVRTTINCLRESSIWPNGNTAGWTFLTLMVGLLLVAVAPPLLPFAVSAGAVPWVWKVLRARTRPSSAAHENAHDESS
jgi:hypothetical protein